MKPLLILLTGEEHPNFPITTAFKNNFDEVHTVWWQHFGQELNDVIQRAVRELKPDFVFMQIQKAEVISEETARIISENSIGFNWTGDVRSDIGWYCQLGKHLVTLFTNNTDVEKMRALNLRADYLQIGYDDKVYFNAFMPRGNQVVFCGSYYKDMGFPLTELRKQAVYAMKLHYGDGFNLYGNGWRDAHIYPEGYANNVQESIIYQTAALALSISHFNYKRYFSDRLLREMACGVCVLSHRYQDFDLDFEDGKHFVVWDDIPDMLEKVAYYLSHPEEAERIGNQAAEYVKEKFTWDAQVKEFKKLVLKYKN